jgi:hypothetical protein
VTVTSSRSAHRLALRLRRRFLYRRGRRRQRGVADQLDRALPEQLERYEALAGDFGERYAALRQHDAPVAQTELWRGYERELERLLLPRPPRDFLGSDVMLETMSLVAGGRLLSRELAYLRTRRSEEDLDVLLGESPIGQPALLDPAHASSHTTVHHLYHLERHRESTGWDWRDVESVVEWGAGYGALARIIVHGTHRPARLTLVDIPLLAALQWLYLSSVLGPASVRVVDGGSPASDAPGIHILPVGLALAAPRRTPITAPVDLFVSTWGLSESSATAQRRIADADFLGARHLLVAYQQHDRLAPDAAAVGPLAARAGAVVEPVSLLRHSDYAFR